VVRSCLGKGPAPAPHTGAAQAPAAQPEPTPLAHERSAGQLGGALASANRQAPLECAIEETAVLTKTGQLVVLVNIRVASDTHAPIAVVQLPLGLSLRAGAKLQVDDGKPLEPANRDL